MHYLSTRNPEHRVLLSEAIAQGIAPRRACDAAITRAIGADGELQQAVGDLIDVIVP